MSWRTVIIGLGQVGLGYDLDIADPHVVLSHAKSFAIHPDFELVGGVDPDTLANARFASRYCVWSGTDLVECLRTCQPEVVVIASPTKSHAQILRSVLRFSKPRLILCEKPLAYTYKEAEGMVADCHAANCLLFVNYLRRVEPGVLEIKRRIESGAISTPLKGVLWYSNGLLHNGSHFSNLLEFWLGPILSFTSINPGRVVSDDDLEPDIHVKFGLGEISFLSVKNENFSHHEIQLIAPNGCLRYEQGGTEILWQRTEKDPLFPAYRVLSPPGERIPAEISRLQWHVVDHLSACMRGKPSTLCTGVDALHTLNSLLKIKAKL